MINKNYSNTWTNNYDNSVIDLTTSGLYPNNGIKYILFNGYGDSLKASGIQQDTGEKVAFNIKYGEYICTDDDICKLLSGKEISVHTGFTYMTCKLGKKEYNGKQFTGLVRVGVQAHDITNYYETDNE